MIHSLIKYIQPNLSKEPNHDIATKFRSKAQTQKLASLQTNFRQMVNKWAMLMTW
jgi:hypothetical protein